jgi:hypothetical protein
MAMKSNLPLIICDAAMNSSVRSVAEDFAKRKLKLSKAMVVGHVGNETLKILTGLGISVEEVAN